MKKKRTETCIFKVKRGVSVAGFPCCQCGKAIDFKNGEGACCTTKYRIEREKQ